MRCTDCSKPVKPIVSLDIDGTLGDYHSHFIEFAEGYFGTELPRHEDYAGTVRFWQYLGLELRDYRDAKLAYRQGGLKRTMPVYDGASELSHALHDADAEVWICTTRPFQRLDNIDPDTREWLRRNGIYYDHMLYGDGKYYQLWESVDAGRVVGVLEDLPEHLAIASDLGFNPVIRMNHHNREFVVKNPSYKRVAGDLKEASDILLNRLQKVEA